ncbi:MAG: hypothetical protein O7C75_04350 [Verrucomicrobia bacterium]|nr:hypothetical protein [Verrucomicrobiota bacterium]
MSYLVKKKRSFMTRCLIKCQNLVMFVLIFSLMLLLAGLGLSIYYDELPVPDRLEGFINEALNEQGLDLKYGKITLDFGGNLLIEDAQLSFTRLEEPALQMDALYLDINYAALILKRPPFDKVRLSNAHFYTPAVVSLSGTTDRMVTQINLEVTKHWDSWNLHFLTAKFGHLDLSANGDLTTLIRKLTQPREREEERPDLYLQYLQLSRILSDYKKILQCFESPKAVMHFNSPSRSEFVVEVATEAESFAWEGLPGAKQIRQTAVAQILPELVLRKPIQLTAELVEYDDLQLQVNKVALSIWQDRPIQNLESVFPFQVAATTSEIIVQGTTVDQAVFTGQVLNREEAQGTLISSFYDGTLEASIQGNWKNMTAGGSLTGSVNLERVFARPEFDHLWKLRWSTQHRPLYLDIEFTYPGNLEGVEARYRAETRDIDIIKTPFKWARARGTLQGTKADVTRLEAGGYGNDLYCTFKQDLKDRFYRFTMVGLFRPHDIDIWWRDWWKKTFDYLDIKGELPFMDMSIRNAFSYKKQLTLFGYAEAENINLKGMHFDAASCKMFIRPNYIDAIELHLKRAEGQASGQFQRQLVESQLKNVLVDISSNIDLDPSMELFGEGGRRIIEPYTWEGNPTITLLGEFNFENDSNWQDVLFTIDTESPMTVYDFPLDSLQVDGHYDHGDVLLHDAIFDFAGGRGEGEISFLRQDEQSYLIFDFNIEDADLAETLKRIAKIKKVPEEEKISEKPKPKKDSKPLEGKLKVHASGISPAGYGLDRVMAKGNIEISEGNLAEIPLFGPLSSLIPFTKLRLNTAKAYFAWDDGKMTFPDLVMTSNTARLEGIGDYYTGKSNLDFQVRLFLLRETDIPLLSSIIMPIFDPLSHIASINLKGTLTKPVWRFAISPFNLFDSNPVPDEEDKKELLEFEFRK